MTAVDYVALNRSPLHCTMNEGMSRDVLDINESSLYFDCPWRDEQQKPSAAAAQSSRPYTVILGSDLMAYGPNTTAARPTTTTTTVTLREEQSTGGGGSSSGGCSDDIESMASLLPDDVNLDSWQRRHPDQWTCEDVLNLIYSVAMQSEDIKLPHFYGENFQNVNGAELRTMDEDDFARRDPNYGRMLHGRLRDILRGTNQFHISREFPTNVKLEKVETAPAIPDGIPITVQAMPFGGSDESGSFEDLDPSFLSLLESMYDVDPQDDFFQIQTTRAMTERTGVSGANCTQTAQASTNELRCAVPPQSRPPHPTQLHQLLLQSLPHRHHLQQQQQQHNHHPETRTSRNCSRLPDNGDLSWLTGVMSRHSGGMTTRNDDRTRPASSDGESSSGGGGGGSSGDGSLRIASNLISNTTSRLHDDVIMGRTMNGGKGNHLWEFLCQQLQRSDTIPAKDRIIQWESKEEGVFRIVDSKEVATQWGLFKGNDKMTYEKLSRALRWCRTNGFLATLPKNGKFPKKLCFRFGQKATNWKDFV